MFKFDFHVVSMKTLFETSNVNYIYCWKTCMKYAVNDTVSNTLLYLYCSHPYPPAHLNNNFILPYLYNENQWQ